VGKALRGEALTIAGDGMQFRKFAYVEDLAEGNLLALKSVGENKIYNLDGNEKVSIKQIAETVQKLVGNTKIEYMPARPGDFAGKEISSKLAKEELGWEPRIRFEEGVRRYIDWYKDRQLKAGLAWANLDKTLESRVEEPVLSA
jgi:UDP-glucose 4-epimerase